MPPKHIPFSCSLGILACYRKHCTSSNSASGQLILPEALKLLPAYMCSVIRSAAFRSGGDISTDERMHSMNYITAMGAKLAMAYFYPRLVSVHDVVDADVGIPAALR